MSKAWTAIALAPALVVVGCSSEPEPVAEVPPPNEVAEPEPLPPVSLNEGSAVDDESAGDGDSDQDAPGVTVGPGGDSPVPDFEPEPLDPQQPATRTYTIRKGDTFWSIAQRIYGDGQRWKDIAQANPSVDPKKLAIGQEIDLP